MQKIIKQGPKFAILILTIACTHGSNSYADGFYTIIGPDGRPMIVPARNSKQNVAEKKQVDKVLSNQSKVKNIDITESSKIQQAEINLGTTKPLAPRIDSVKSLASKADNTQSETIPTLIQAERVNPTTQQKYTPPSKVEKEVKASIVQEQKSSSVTETSNIAVAQNKPIAKEKSHSAFEKIDGIEYVNSDYLEDQEFNLDGKKRFYMMPDGSGRLETVERKKGVSRSVLDKLLNRSVQSTVPIALSESYIRLSTQDLALAFEDDQCFLENYSKSIKTLTSKKDVGLWPRKPLKEKFEYDLVKLDSSIQYLQIDSYAASAEKPVYYWPLVVFLDEKGCVKEGVSGFKNGETRANLLQHAAINGVIKVPANVKYVMMTPLASAVDLPENRLTNQGQIKISVIQ
ncbi:putative pilus assembly protein FilE [Acinetobacter haemolyticus]|uniref:Putative pilus assembly protein FilE n=1 Tax=Acinetobacter haemolyticus TaxID=29430 RepID=A0A4P7B783_ACIHA|nr:putative pilus assembly protein FilE [Acinetobacter haemolyticus]QBQ17024.1 putative pilus assembly protein FilE [Acinetobacter haemolyticus]